MSRFSPLSILKSARGFWRWLNLLADLSEGPESGRLQSAYNFLEEREAWANIMNTIQFSERACAEVLEGLAKRHGQAIFQPFDGVPNERLLTQLTPLIWFFYSQKERFPENTVGHGCTISLLYTLFRAAGPGATRHQVLWAVREEMNAQLKDVCTANPPGGDVILS